MRATQTHHYRNVFNKMKFLTSLPLNPCYRPSPHCLQDPSLSMINPYRSSSPVPRTPSHYWPCLPHTHTHSLAPSLPKGGRASGCDKGASISSNLTAESHDQCPLTILTEPSPLKPSQRHDAHALGGTLSKAQAKEPFVWVHAGGLLRAHMGLRHSPLQVVYSVLSVGTRTKNDP